jgi:phage shock protein A
MRLRERAVRIFQATLHDVIDHMGNKQKLIAHHLLEMKEGIDELEQHVKNLERERNSAETERACRSEIIKRLDEQIMEAIKIGEEARARTLIGKKLRCKLDLEPMESAYENLAAELKTYGSELSRRQRCYEAMKQKAAEWNERNCRTSSPAKIADTTSSSSEGDNENIVELELLRIKEFAAKEVYR